jgi:ubiquitin-conjugating enzyme E2 variant
VLIADFITGLVHWFEDTFITPETPVLGKAVGIPNVEHHREPHLMATKGNFYTRNRLPMLMAVIVCSVALLFHVLSWQLVLIVVLAGLGNEVHEWNHRPRPKNRVAAFLQDSGLVQSRRQHGLHHKAPYNQYYCTLTNFTNAVLERIHFWRGMEWCFVNILHLEIQRQSAARQGY